MSRLSVPDASEEERDTIGALAMRITEEARARYGLHRRTRRRIHSDLGTLDKRLTQKLTAWRNLDFPAFRAEIKKKIYYSPETDNLSIKLRTGEGAVVGEIMGEDLNENVVLHRDDAGTLYEIEVVGGASKVFDLSRFPAREQSRLSLGDSVAFAD